MTLKAQATKVKNRQIGLELQYLYASKDITEWKGNLWNEKEYLQIIYEKGG